MLENLNVDLDEIRYEIMKTLDPEYDADSEDDYEVASDDATPAGGAEATASPGRSKSKTPALNSFGRDLNKLAEDHARSCNWTRTRNRTGHSNLMPKNKK